MTNSKTLRRIIKEATNQDIARCLGCSVCDTSLPDQDVPLGSLIQLALMDDEEALQSRTLWSDAVLAAAHSACQRGLNLSKILTALRAEARQRGISNET